MSTPETGGGLLLVHAHPDDESIETGATMARYAAAGVPVTLVTCTLGELGEIIPADLAYLAAGRGDLLGKYRIGELEAACAALGVRDHRFLGGPGRWRDSGMMGLPSNDDPGCFWQADLDEAVLAWWRSSVRCAPGSWSATTTGGSTGIPTTSRRTGWPGGPSSWPAIPASVPGPSVPGPSVPGPSVPGGGPWPVAKFYATAMPRSVLAAATDLSGRDGEAVPAGFIAEPAADTVPFGAADGEVTTEIDGSAYLGAKTAAMRAHATQITVREPYFALSNWVGQRILAREYYTLLAGPRGPAGPSGRETDLFAGLG